MDRPASAEFAARMRLPVSPQVAMATF